MIINDNAIIEVSNSSKSMMSAAAKLGLHYNTFRKHAIRLNCFNPNPSGKGYNKVGKPRVNLNDILDGKHPEFQTFKLKHRLLSKGIIKNICSVCGISDWMGKQLNMELDHINGNRCDHKLENLRMLCPNCHAQTDTYRAKNIK